MMENIENLDPIHEKFIDELQDLLSKYCSDQDEKICRNIALSLFYEGINVMFQNSSNKFNVYFGLPKLFKNILNIFIERPENKEICQSEKIINHRNAISSIE